MKLISRTTFLGAGGVSPDCCSSLAVNLTQDNERKASFIKTSTHCMRRARKKSEVSEHVRNRNLWHIVAVEAKHLKEDKM